MTFCLPVEEVIATNLAIEKGRHAVLDVAKLEAALARPMHGFGDTLFYPTVVERAAVLLESLAAAHAFIDGNKRTAWISCNVYLNAFGLPLRMMTREEAGGMVVAITTHQVDLQTLALWFTQNQAE